MQLGQGFEHLYYLLEAAMADRAGGWMHRKRRLWMVPGVRAVTAHDLLTVRGSVENYDAQILCMGQNVIAPSAAWALIDIWLDLRHDPTSDYGPKVGEIAAYEARLHS